MTAAEIIAEIEALPREEKEEVIRFACRLSPDKPLSGAELTVLEERLVHTDVASKTTILREEIMTGFYGKE